MDVLLYLITQKAEFVCEQETEEELLWLFWMKEVWVPAPFLSGDECGEGTMGWRETERQRETGMDAAVCTCQRQGYPLGDLRPRHCHFGYHGDTVNEHMHR